MASLALTWQYSHHDPCSETLYPVNISRGIFTQLPTSGCVWSGVQCWPGEGMCQQKLESLWGLQSCLSRDFWLTDTFS